MNKLKGIILGVLGAIGIGGTSVAVANANSYRPSDVTFDILQQGDSTRVIARWKPKCDSKGCPDRYRVTWGTGVTPRPEKTVVPALDTAWFRTAPLGDSIQIGLAVRAVRRGQSSAMVTATRWLVNRDAPPPPPDSLVIDTLAVTVDSVRVRWLTASGIPTTEAPLLNEGDSVRVVAQYYLTPGTTRRMRDSTTWAVVQLSTGTARVRAFGSPMRDSAWFVAVSCGCLEQRDAVLDIKTGQWVVRVADGSLRRATPAHTLPFRRADG